MALALTGGGMASENHSHQIDQAYTVARVRWMLENYHALLSRKPMDPEKDVKPGATSRHTQWWTSQAFWRKADRKADLDKAIDWLAEQGDYRARLLLIVMYTETPRRTKWDEAAGMIAVSERQAYRIEEKAVDQIAWYLGGKLDT